MSEAEETPEEVPPETPEWPPSEPDVSLDEEAPAQEQPSSEEATAPASDGLGDEEPAESKLEDVDPEPEVVDAAADVDRKRGLDRTFNTTATGDSNRIYQAGKIEIFGNDVSALPRHGAVPAEVLPKLASVYVRPECAQEIMSALDASPVLCLVGSPGTGRTTTTIAVAAEYLKQHGLTPAGNVHILATDRGLAAVNPSSLPENTALLLTLPADAPAPDVAWFGPIGASLIAKKSILIVVSAAEPVGPAAFRAEWTIQYAPPPTDEVFRRHLARHLSDQRVREVSSLPQAREHVSHCRSPREAARLAREVIDDIESGTADDDLFSAEPTDRLATARKELSENELWHRIFLVTTSVMFGLPAGTVTREAMRLAELHKPNAIQSEAPRIDWFNGPMPRWSECIELHGGHVDDGAGQIVKLVHPKLAIPLLRAIWQEHIGERDVLLMWLRGLGAHPLKRVRVKSALAVAQLAGYDFDVIVREVIQIWALDGGYRTRQTCAMALETLAFAAGGRFNKRVSGLVRSWARSNNVQLAAAAVTVYGTFLGAKDPDEALDRMHDIIGWRVLWWDGQRHSLLDGVERGLATIIHHALLEVFAVGAQEKVVQVLAGWATHPHWRWRRASARALLDLARKDGDSGWPRLVELANAQERTYSDILDLWRNALDSSHRTEASWDAMRRWCDMAEERRNDPDSGTAAALIDHLLADLRDTERITKSLAFHQRIWAFRKSQP